MTSTAKTSFTGEASQTIYASLRGAAGFIAYQQKLKDEDLLSRLSGTQLSIARGQALHSLENKLNILKAYRSPDLEFELGGLISDRLAVADNCGDSEGTMLSLPGLRAVRQAYDTGGQPVTSEVHFEGLEPRFVLRCGSEQAPLNWPEIGHMASALAYETVLEHTDIFRTDPDKSSGGGSDDLPKSRLNTNYSPAQLEQALSLINNKLGGDIFLGTSMSEIISLCFDVHGLHANQNVVALPIETTLCGTQLIRLLLLLCGTEHCPFENIRYILQHAFKPANSHGGKFDLKDANIRRIYNRVAEAFCVDDGFRLLDISDKAKLLIAGKRHRDLEFSKELTRILSSGN